MSPDKEETLIAICPEIFPSRDDRLPITYFGFECGDGWFELLKECLEGIKKVVKDLTVEDEMPKVAQVKEKFGTLRFYMNNSTSKTEDLIEAAEVKSARTCENCGSPGTAREISRWWFIRCDDCFSKNS